VSYGRPVSPVSKESVPIDGRPERESEGGIECDGSPRMSRSGQSSDGGSVGATDGRDHPNGATTVATGDGDELSAIALVFGMGSTPDDVEPELDSDERAALESADVDPEAVARRECSYRMLLDAAVAEPLADKLRRRFSLPWSFSNDGDLDRRSTEVRGLGDAEREWVAVSGDESWQSFDITPTREPDADRETPADRPFPRPTPVTAVMGVGPDDADELARAGIVSAERLATIDGVAIASVLDLDVRHVRTWRHNARELIG